MSVVIQYIPASSPVHRLHAMTKLLGALVVLTLSILFNDPYSLSILFISLLGLAAYSSVLRDLLPGIKGLGIFAIFLMVLQVLFYQDGRILFYAIPGTSWLAITDQGIIFGLAMGLRMMAIVTSFIIFLATTPTRDIVMTLVEHLKVPYDYAFLFITAIRFIPTFIEEVHLIRQAQEARAHQIEGKGPIAKLRSLFPVALPLVMISLHRADRIAMAMETRGFGLPGRTHYRAHGLKAADGVIMALLIGMVILAVILRFV